MDNKPQNQQPPANLPKPKVQAQLNQLDTITAQSSSSTANIGKLVALAARPSSETPQEPSKKRRRGKRGGKKHQTAAGQANGPEVVQPTHGSNPSNEEIIHLR
jgi:hypothetical protein